jgi:putative SOS response-associated peptidase YedK
MTLISGPKPSANELIAPIHDRMLAILPNEQFPRWLSDEADPRDLLVPFPADQLAVASLV